MLLTPRNFSRISKTCGTLELGQYHDFPTYCNSLRPDTILIFNYADIHAFDGVMDCNKQLYTYPQRDLEESLSQR